MKPTAVAAVIVFLLLTVDTTCAQTPQPLRRPALQARNRTILGWAVLKKEAGT